MVILKSRLAREVRKLTALAVPIIAGQVGQMVLGLVDTVMIGRVGVVPLAAAAFAGTVFSVPLIFGFGILASVSILVARSYGSDRATECGEFLRHGLVIALVSSTLFAVGLTSVAGWLDRLGQPPEVVAAARTYFVIISWSLIPVYVFQVLKQFSEALSSAWPPDCSSSTASRS
jgi:MATE family multidrug resistance protein